VNVPPWINFVRWNPDGLIPAIVQDAATGDILMMAWMDRDAVLQTIASGQTHFYSRSRQRSWHKGGTSGHVQHIQEIRLDCDGDTLLIRVQQVGGACHEGYRTCFFRQVDARGELAVLADRVFDPVAVYQPGG
jgi:phosphoribosyl-AMP cyclohydrolase